LYIILLYLLKNQKQMNNLCQLALQKGGSVNYLTLPANMTEGLGLTNPSILIHDGYYLLNLRHVQYALYHSEGEQKFQTPWGPLAYLNPEDDVTLRTTNYLCQLDPNTLAIDKFQKVDTTKLDVKPIWEFIGLEDCRVVYWDDTLYLTGVRRDTTTNGEGRMELSTIEDKGKETKRVRIEPPTKGSYCEKNWMPVLDLPYHYVKWSSPTEVVKVDPIKGTSKTVALVEQKVKLPRDIRGGSQVITYGDYYVALTHEVNLWFNEQGKKDAHYYHRFIVWDKEWNIVHYSPEFKFMTGNIEFSCGLAFDGDNFIIPFGFQDSTAFILKLPVTLFNQICDIPQTSIKPIDKGVTPHKLEQFINDPYNASKSFDMGTFYFSSGHYASALSFFLRAAEYSKYDEITYDSLIMVAKSLSALGRRKVTELGLWQNAIAFEPTKPDAYLYISEYHEQSQNYHQAYANAIQGLIFTDTGGTNYWELTFQKAVAAWHIGRGKESRDIFAYLADNAKLLSEKYQKLVQSNITSLGSGPDPFLRYHKGFYDQLKYKFPGAENIEKNYSQTYQDMFVLTMLNGKRNGKYFEIGAADPYYGSNSALLEEFGWTGTSLEIKEEEVTKFNAVRKNKATLIDATKFDYSILKGHIDYLQVDCEPPSITFEILKMIPFEQCTFGVITFEHDYYADITRSYRELGRNYLLSKGYVLVASNIAPDDTSAYEDWWVHPKHVDPEIIKVMLKADDTTKNAEKYMLGMS
jgi:tetratricopeptide (TPR) repeat protein